MEGEFSMPQEKYVFVYGAGISGCGVAEVLAKKGERVLLFNDDDRTIDEGLMETLSQSGGKYICNKQAVDFLPQVKQFIISPGISIRSPLAQQASAAGIEVIGEVEKAVRMYRGKLVAITGTNGKTTTTTLVGEMLKTLPVKTAVGGNIGQALSKEMEGLGKEDWLVAELSSFQLEGVSSLKPNIAAILNITPDHLDRHGNMEEYAKVKANIFAKQTADDILILNIDDKIVANFAKEAKSTICYISRKEQLENGVFLAEGNFVLAWNGQRRIICGTNEMKIFGAHNEENALVAIACAFFAGVKEEEIKKVLRTFQGVEHRLEYVMSIDGVAYYNDSKATNPDSTIKALEAFPGHIILLAGGRDKMTDLKEMMALVKSKVDELILLGEAKERFLQAARLAGVENIHVVNTFDEGVQLAHTLAREPQVVLLSPACASYDMFDNFPHRGQYFKELVHNLDR